MSHLPVCSTLRSLMAGVLLAAAFAGVGRAQVADRAAHEMTVTIPEIQQMRVTSLGRILPPQGGYESRLCNQISTHTDASFGGGTYTAQGGFAQGEMLAQTYTVPAAEWPIKIISTEAIFATSNATVATTTQWSVLFYSGTPQNGTLIETFSSDDVILPHIHMNPGTNGVNVQFSIDPNDPEQLFIPNNGSNQFTVAYRIDHHNNQTSNPCSVQPPSNSNAFPVTDNTVSPAPCNQYPQLAQSTLNWLYGVNCGSSGCPSNGGWARFSTLAGDTSIGSFCLPGCRPHGDWVLRATWSGVNCQPGVGGCCLPSGACSVMTSGDCGTAGGIYGGDGSACGSLNCPQPQGACCFPNGFCAVVGSLDCANAGGTFAGANSVCGANNTCPLGACCLPNGTCAGNMSQADCTNAGGTFRGAGTNCDTPCPPPNGACCASNGFCFQTTAANCAGSGGTFYGAGVACGVGNVCPIGACCLPNGTCVANVTAAACTAQGGSYAGNGSTCASANCPQPQGACCSATGSCFITSSTTCAGAGGTFGGPGSTCADNNGNGTPDVCESGCGTSDFNGDGDFGTDADIESFFACLGGNCCATCFHGGSDFNQDGDFGTDADIESFFRVLAGGDC